MCCVWFVLSCALIIIKNQLWALRYLHVHNWFLISTLFVPVFPFPPNWCEWIRGRGGQRLSSYRPNKLRATNTSCALTGDWSCQLALMYYCDNTFKITLVRTSRLRGPLFWSKQNKTAGLLIVFVVTTNFTWPLVENMLNGFVFLWMLIF